MRTLILLAAVCAAAAACATSADCSLNGDCVGGACVCDYWWSGSAACDVLAFLPASRASGYHNSSGVASWGGMSIRDDAGAWHLFAAEMEGHCGLQSWTTNSRVVRGVSAGGPAGPFSIVQGVSVPFSHNPKIFRAPDGTYLLFSIGTGLWTTTPQQCGAGAAAPPPPPLPGPTGDGCGAAPLNSGCGLSLGTSQSLAGPWSFAAINVTNQSSSALLDCAHTNPSPWIDPATGRIVMAINAGFCHAQLETIGLLSAPSYAGPWTFLAGGAPILHNADGSIHHCEDPFLWRTQRGWHLMVHNQEGTGISLYAHSLDGERWVLHNEAGNPGPYSGNVDWDDGSRGTYDVERPQFIFDPDSGQPLYLTNGAQGAGQSFTLFRPLRQTPPPPPPPPVRLVNAAGACLTPASPWPCFNASGGFSTCPLIAGDCAAAGALWRVDAAAATIVQADASAAPINLDCDSCDAGALAKIISSGASPLALDAAARQIRAAACSGMCLTTGAAAGAHAPCGGSGEPWSTTSVHLAACSSAGETAGWTAQPAAW